MLEYGTSWNVHMLLSAGSEQLGGTSVELYTYSLSFSLYRLDRFPSEITDYIADSRH